MENINSQLRQVTVGSHGFPVHTAKVLAGFFYMSKIRMIVYSEIDLKNIKKYKCVSKIRSANQRFDDTICVNDVFKVIEKFHYKCIYCDSNLIPDKWQLDHYFPKAMGGKNVPENIVPSCKWCNMMKGYLDGFAFMGRCKKVAENNLLTKLDLKIYDHSNENKK